MLLDPETFDLVQHVDTVLEAMAGSRVRGARQPGADAVGARGRDAGVPDTGGRRARVAAAARLRDRDRAGAGTARRVRRHAPVQPLRAPADHGPRPLPQPRRPDAVRGAARADLRAARARRGRRSGQGDPGRQRAAPASRAAARALGELAVLARRADRARVVAADDLRRVPAVGPAAALPRLRRLRGGRRPAREDRLHRRLHAHLVGHPAAPAPRHGRGPDLRRGHAPRGCDRDHRVHPIVGEAALRATRGGRGGPDVPPHPHDREQVARGPLRARSAGHGSRDRQAQPRAGRAARPAHAEGDRAARARARLRARARRASAPSRAATAPTGSCGSSTRTATSSRS